MILEGVKAKCENLQMTFGQKLIDNLYILNVIYLKL